MLVFLTVTRVRLPETQRCLLDLRTTTGLDVPLFVFLMNDSYVRARIVKLDSCIPKIYSCKYVI